MISLGSFGIPSEEDLKCIRRASGDYPFHV